LVLKPGSVDLACADIPAAVAHRSSPKVLQAIVNRFAFICRSPFGWILAIPSTESICQGRTVAIFAQARAAARGPIKHHAPLAKAFPADAALFLAKAMGRGR
jgi:hypothetical protein